MVHWRRLFLAPTPSRLWVVVCGMALHTLLLPSKGFGDFLSSGSVAVRDRSASVDTAGTGGPFVTPSVGSLLVTEPNHARQQPQVGDLQQDGVARVAAVPSSYTADEAIRLSNIENQLKCVQDSFASLRVLVQTFVAMLAVIAALLLGAAALLLKPAFDALKDQFEREVNLSVDKELSAIRAKVGLFFQKLEEDSLLRSDQLFTAGHTDYNEVMREFGGVALETLLAGADCANYIRDCFLACMNVLSRQISKVHAGCLNLRQFHQMRTTSDSPYPTDLGRSPLRVSLRFWENQLQDGDPDNRTEVLELLEDIRETIKCLCQP